MLSKVDPIITISDNYLNSAFVNRFRALYANTSNYNIILVTKNCHIFSHIHQS